MYDIKWIRDNAAAFDAGLVNRGAEALSGRLIALDDRRRAAIQVAQTSQERRNALSRRSARPWPPRTRPVPMSSRRRLPR